MTNKITSEFKIERHFDEFAFMNSKVIMINLLLFSPFPKNIVISLGNLELKDLTNNFDKDPHFSLSPDFIRISSKISSGVVSL